MSGSPKTAGWRDVAVQGYCILNRRLAHDYKTNGWTFIDTWDSFYSMDHLYQRDGIHLSQEGVQNLSDPVEDGYEKCTGADGNKRRTI